jgi:hypothetical protein
MAKRAELAFSRDTRAMVVKRQGGTIQLSEKHARRPSVFTDVAISSSEEDVKTSGSSTARPSGREERKSAGTRNECRN